MSCQTISLRTIVQALENLTVYDFVQLRIYYRTVYNFRLQTLDRCYFYLSLVSFIYKKRVHTKNLLKFPSSPDKWVYIVKKMFGVLRTLLVIVSI